METSMSKKQKLKPEHRKLWRRIYLLEYERCGQTQSCAADIADDVVAQWEERGAFDDDTNVAPPTVTTSSSAPAPFVLVVPADCDAAARTLVDLLRGHIKFTPTEHVDELALAAKTDIGRAILMLGMVCSVSRMVAIARMIASDIT